MVNQSTSVSSGIFGVSGPRCLFGSSNRTTFDNHRRPLWSQSVGNASSTMTLVTQKHSCTICVRRKVKCDKLSPCSTCSRTGSDCVYRPPPKSQRHRKRLADDDLLSKIREYEGLLQEHNIKFQPLDNSWIPSPLELKWIPRPQSDVRAGDSPEDQSESEMRSESEGATKQLQIESPNVHPGHACLWFDLPQEVR